jgi:hypothetical protein
LPGTDPLAYCRRQRNWWQLAPRPPAAWLGDCGQESRVRGSLVTLALAAGSLVACGTYQTTSAPPGVPASIDGAASPPLGAATPTRSATPATTLTVKQLAAAYLEAAATINRASHNAWATWDESPQTITHAKRLAKAYAAAELTFIRAVQKVPWYGVYNTLARIMLTYDNRRYVSHRSAMKSKTWVDWNECMAEAHEAGLEGLRASNELRVALGLRPVPFQ